MNLHAWIDNGLMFIVRASDEKQEHAVFTEGGHVVWLPNGRNGEVQALIDIEKFQINSGRAWPPAEPPIAL